MDRMVWIVKAVYISTTNDFFQALSRRLQEPVPESLDRCVMDTLDLNDWWVQLNWNIWSINPGWETISLAYFEIIISESYRRPCWFAYKRGVSEPLSTTWVMGITMRNLSSHEMIKYCILLTSIVRYTVKMNMSDGCSKPRVRNGDKLKAKRCGLVFVRINSKANTPHLKSLCIELFMPIGVPLMIRTNNSEGWSPDFFGSREALR